MTETMWAARLQESGQPLVISRMPVLRPGHGELLLKLETSGICHTDLHVAEAKAFPAGCPQSLTLGHEGIGYVVEQGQGTMTALGTRLGAPWLHDTCEQCRCCLTGRESFCPTHRAHGYAVSGSFAEYKIVKKR